MSFEYFPEKLIGFASLFGGTFESFGIDAEEDGEIGTLVAPDGQCGGGPKR